MAGTSWEKTREGISKWASNLMGIIIIGIMTGIYNKMESFTAYAIESRKDMENIKEKIEDLKAENKAQDAHLITHDQLLYLKPEEVQVKFKIR